MKKIKTPNKEIIRNSPNISSYATMDLTAVIDIFKTQNEGLTTKEADSRLEEFGPNQISEGYKDTVWSKLFEAIINPFNVILIVIAVVTFITDIVIPARKDFFTFAIIILLVFVSSTISFIQSQSSSKAIEKLTNQINNTSHVYRDATLIQIPQNQVVPGDIVHLGAGDVLPADIRFIQTRDTFIAQSALTGESTPVEKFSHTLNDKDMSLTDLENIGFMGSNMISGSARGVVLATGDSTYFGSMAGSLTGDRAKNSFERGVEDISQMLIRMMLIIVPVVFVINAFNKGDWGTSLVFAISIAVGLTPEMLPVITNSTLAVGAQNMAKQKVIVRSTSAIQSFGEMDVLCTDKTGTLTEDKIVVERYMNLNGDDDRRVLRHAYLNSYFQTGLKNLIDFAIINRAEGYKFDSILNNYEVVDEVPFDFNRRRMSVVLEDKTGKCQLITKGAVEEMLSISSFIELDGKVYPLDDEKLAIAKETYETYNHQGLRMIAVAQKNNIPDSEHFSIADESDMVLIGFMGFLDPPKKSATPAIKALEEHKVRTVVLTGDSEGVAINVCNEVGIATNVVYTGGDIEAMTDLELSKAVEECNLFAKLAPSQKTRVISVLQSIGHTVGFLGDGINDAPALRRADVGISVDTAVDIAKETADIVLLEKDLMVLERGVLEGRKTFGNIMKYIKMATSGNFGNIISILFASLFLPFLPILPVQLLTQNLLNDFAQIGMPFDNIDENYLIEPKSWNTRSVRNFMYWLGPVSSIFDILCFAILWFVMDANTLGKAPLFQAGWFIFGTLSQIIIIHMIRTSKTPFIESMSSNELTLSTFIVGIIACVVAFSDIAIGLDMSPLPVRFIPWFVLLLIGYMVAVQLVKKLYIKRYNELI
ncbi:magnesium-translocating P-type ATPase [Candidatus Galacturonibacter soehngenii]|uniref:Magnesium-transporting ATPase, P-type 1 n=1 Tax=Candidatus Galacturonatibacter soehngenii TaxID=2307010 RepID=A0A7V7QLP5_9FIRM|nr:magnesium-translocating P-type ATPase [Candidatus Galacturonibacter soehngenii]KAB1439482.1 magnesium-translocating P-type ATPase [Candidatus Galacturonibacter soehngenii]